MNDGLAVRFWPKVRLTPDCWLWTASVDRKGYGKIGEGGRGRRTLAAHRVAFELCWGPIPDGALVMHLCDNPPCVRPTHLRLGTQAENMQDMASKGRQWMQLRTHCSNGHEYTDENTYRYGNRRRCKTCCHLDYLKRRSA